MVHAVPDLARVQGGRLGIAPVEDVVHEAAFGVGTALDVVESGDGWERGVGASDRIEEVEVGGLVGGDEPAVRGADRGVAGERGLRQGGSDGIAGEGAADDGAVCGGIAACVDQAGELIPGDRKGEAMAADG